jgi:hypothetical protein
MPAIVVMIDLIPVPRINDHVIVPSMIMSPIITPMVSPIIGTINTNCHHGCKSKPGGIKSIIIRRNIGHIGRGIYILHNRC